MTEGVPLVIPEINAEAVKAAGITAGKGGIIANPNCSTIIMLMAVAPLHRAAGVKRVVVSTWNLCSPCRKQSRESRQQKARQRDAMRGCCMRVATLTSLSNDNPDLPSVKNITYGAVRTAGEHVPGSQRRGAGSNGRARTADAGGAGRRGGHHQHLPVPGTCMNHQTMSALGSIGRKYF